MQRGWLAVGMHGFAGHAYIEGELVALFLNTNAFGMDDGFIGWGQAMLSG
jgi:hypothetical protein